jgi:putative cardiolipin synthase
MRHSQLHSVWVVCCLLLIAGCASHWQPASLPEAPAESVVHIALWEELDERRADDWFHLLNTGYEALAWRLRAIDSAVSSIDIQTFIWKDDQVGELLLSHVLAAADRGVDVRILVDDSFLAGRDQTIARVAMHPRLRYRIYNPLLHRNGNTFTRQMDNVADFSRIDHRMHNKLMLVDGQVAIVGGRNLANEYFGYHSRHNFRDMEVLLGGSTVGELLDSFEIYWNDRWARPVQEIAKQPAAVQSDQLMLLEGLHWPAESAMLRRVQWLNMVERAATGTARVLVDQPPDDPAVALHSPPSLTTQLLASLAEVQEEVILVSAYFVPTPVLQTQLQALVERAVAVKLLTNSLASNNHATAHSAYQRYRKPFIEGGAELFEVRADAEGRARYMVGASRDRMLGLHAKVMVMDTEQVFIGSANLDPRSLRLNTEVGLLIDSPQLNARLREDLAPDLMPANAWRVELDDAGRLRWVSGQSIIAHEPEASFFLRSESWLFGLLPIEAEM